MELERLIISAPFGNWSLVCFPHTTPTIGTFTAEYRGGAWWRLWKVLKTVRYYPGIQAWKNKLGLPNPGIDYLVKRRDKMDFSNKIISVAGRKNIDWARLVWHACDLKPAAVEMNVSCPNCGDLDTTSYGSAFAAAALDAGEAGVPLIVKLPPVNYALLADLAMDAGINRFHCCNTLPTPAGGLSGKPLKALSLDCLWQIRATATTRGHHLETLIGGGGVTEMPDVEDYQAAGATHVAVGSTLFFPWRWPTIKRMAEALHLAAKPNAVDSARTS